MSRSRLSVVPSLAHGRLFRLVSSAAALASLMVAPGAHAADLTWGGEYRVEAEQVQGSELNSANTDKAYVLHHLILNPKMVVADGITINSRLDILNNSAYGINSSGQINSVAGDLLGGSGPGTTGTGGPVTGTDSNAWGMTENAGTIAVSELYLTWAHEFGQFVVGRVPLNFGLGIGFNAGTGLFDHYITTKDLAGYKVVLGNFYVMPMIAKVNEGALNTMNDVNDYILQAQYENPESELTIAAMYDLHVVTGNDTPLYNSSNPSEAASSYLGGPGATRTGSFKNTLMAFYFSERPTSQLRVSFEFDLAQGDTGIQTGTQTNSNTPATNSGVGLNSFGVAGEIRWIPPVETKWAGVLKLGLATGDDPGTYDTDEGYQFNRDYHVAQLLFRQPLGQADFLRTGMIRPTGTTASAQLDDEAVSNAIYIAPTIEYHQRENLFYGLTLVYARLNKDPIGPNVATGVGSGESLNLGYEGDFNVTWNPMERLTWTTGIAALLPGDAWRGGTNNNFENRMAFGAVTKAAISF